MQLLWLSIKSQSSSDHSLISHMKNELHTVANMRHHLWWGSQEAIFFLHLFYIWNKFFTHKLYSRQPNHRPKSQNWQWFNSLLPTEKIIQNCKKLLQCNTDYKKKGKYGINLHAIDILWVHYADSKKHEGGSGNFLVLHVLLYHLVTKPQTTLCDCVPVKGKRGRFL